jgi:plastocyanin
LRAGLVIAILLGTCCVCFGQQITVTGRVELSGNSANRSSDPSDTVVWLTPIGDQARIQSASAHPRAQLLQKKKTFTPHLLVVQVGSPVEFPNQDPFFHNVFSLFEGKRFDLGLYEAGTTRSVIFNRAGVSYIFCNIHPDMSAVVVTLNTPYYAISDRNGVITIPNVPTGSYDMEAWHERVLPETLNSLKRRLMISTVSSSLGIIHLTEQRNISLPHKNKYGRDYDNPSPNAPGYTRQ